MKQKLLAILIFGGLSTIASAQSSVTLYGVLDVGIRMNTHQTADGGKQYTMGNGGALSSDRWGLLGSEDLGGGMKAFFRLESGFTPNTGALQQATPAGGTRLFGRTALVGLSGSYGAVSLGRQYTLIHETVAANDIFQLANYSQTYAFQAAGETAGARLDNTVRYTSPKIAGFTLRGQYTLGGVAGDFHHASSPEVSFTYENGPLSVNGAYVVVNDIGGLTPATSTYGSTYYGITIPDSSQKEFNIGATYKFSNLTLYGNYIYSHVWPADYKNNSFSVAGDYFVTPAFDIRLPVYVDFLRHANTSGTRITTGPLFDYHFSKSTDVYTGFDYTHLTGAWTTLASNSGFTIPLHGYNTMLEVFVGLRHLF
ncbi:porin [Burkholderia multivorans]|uniref:porin n=1 Tax=Burkholderia multivorans TaxID=87883 RepID=UPI0021C0E6D8|nr:porin [Burkholderia multivorans]MDR8762373.1 Outer membrane porin protein 32 [Burkholderia multivorans]MDR8766189.1 Outer membrane porin protein 32 [Burkholderia multivorans]MDR8770025.1 Outer membrane porin protein 32 [Burkholderia multivorans]MDR8789742.1 Outer membrane porin protein 32 [Burkholderia multivorans]MDR8794578.1 Outer membrane porin protein 32 [Burkholderia multivorans]